MNWALVISALETHVGISQRALDFFRERSMGKEFEDGKHLLDEAVRALIEATAERDRLLREKNLKTSNPKFSKGRA